MAAAAGLNLRHSPLRPPSGRRRATGTAGPDGAWTPSAASVGRTAAPGRTGSI